ncbi:MAG TPA: hypothetical protein VGF49_17240, partial [Candidatus Solibacter sp.]
PDPVPPLHPSVLPSEDFAAHQLLVSEYYARFNPSRPEERSFVDDIIYCEWTLRRLVRAETELFLYLHENACTIHPDYPLGQVAAEHAKLLNALQWRGISTRKALKEAIDGLRDLRLHPIPDPVPLTPTIEDPLPEIGFVLETAPALLPQQGVGEHKDQGQGEQRALDVVEQDQGQVANRENAQQNVPQQPRAPLSEGLRSGNQE